MASLSEIARERTDLGENDIRHLRRLVRSWGLMADLSFSDLLLFARTKDDEGSFIVLGHVRPSTGQTMYRADPVGQVFRPSERPLVRQSYHHSKIEQGELSLRQTFDELVGVQSVPVRGPSGVVGVMTSESHITTDRPRSEMDRTYVHTYQRLAEMVKRGEFPYSRQEEGRFRAPRVGDGTVVLDSNFRVDFASPNAVSAFHRLGVHRNLFGIDFLSLGLGDDEIEKACSHRQPVIVELENGRETTVVMHYLPLLDGGEVTGGLLALRDISDLRRRDRLLMSKEATIREIHHRVKNNLQTISSLLRIQSRRVDSAEAKAALDESVRRIASIALVHETLSQDTGEDHDTGDDVVLVELVKPLVRMVEESMVLPGKPIVITVEGDAGIVPSEVAMPLSVVITELLQNTADHAFGFATVDQPGHVLVSLGRDDESLRLCVSDDGVGLPEGFALESTGLGLTIVRAFICDELVGTIDMAAGDGPPGRRGTRIALTIPVRNRRKSDRARSH
ncbi:MAG: histidine kinase N-terminal domain-containing protein [Acidimicrobiales bacterium]